MSGLGRELDGEVRAHLFSRIKKVRVYSPVCSRVCLENDLQYGLGTVPRNASEISRLRPPGQTNAAAFGIFLRPERMPEESRFPQRLEPARAVQSIKKVPLRHGAVRQTSTKFPDVVPRGRAFTKELVQDFKKFGVARLEAIQHDGEDVL